MQRLRSYRTVTKCMSASSFSLWVCRLLFRRTTPGMLVGQRLAHRTHSAYSDSRMSRILGSVRMSCPTAGVISWEASWLGCCSCLCGSVEVESGVAVSSFEPVPCSVCPLWSVLPSVTGSGANGAWASFSASSSVCVCCVLSPASSVSSVAG